MKRITAKDHFRLIRPVVAILTIMGFSVLLYWWAEELVFSPFRTFLICGGLSLYLSPLIVLHIQYWHRNKNMGVEFEGNTVQIHSEGMAVRTVLPDEITEVEKVIAMPSLINSFYVFPSSRYFIYYLWLKGKREPIILTSLLVGACPALDALAREREKLIPYIDVEKGEAANRKS